MDDNQFQLSEAIEILARTPSTLTTLLSDLPDAWTQAHEGPETWSTYDVIGHLIAGEKTDWFPRTQTILNHGKSSPFVPFDRFLQFEESVGKSLGELLLEFNALRAQNLDKLQRLVDTTTDFSAEGVHPDFGPVTLKQLLSAWVVHDLGHIAQIVRVMAKRYSREAGPWIDYLPILTERT